MSFTLAVASFVVSTLATADQTNQQRKATREQKEQIEISSAEESVRNQESRRRQFREARVRRAQIEQAASNTGTTGSSGELGALNNLGTGVAANLASSNRQINTSEALTASSQRGLDAKVRSQTAAGVGQVSRSIFDVAIQNPETMKKFSTIFGGS